MGNIRLLADMNISPKTVGTLQQHGWDVTRVSEILPINASDPEILELARREGRVLVTQDLDFSSLLALGGYDRPSLITLRLLDSSPELVSRRLLEILPSIEEKVLQEGCAVTIEEMALRVRQLKDFNVR